MKQYYFTFYLLSTKKVVGFPTSLPRHSLNEKSISRLRNHGIVHGTKAPLTTIHSGLCPPQSTPDRIRTCDPLLRRQLLYPTELRAHNVPLFYFTFYYLSRVFFADNYFFSSFVFSSLIGLKNMWCWIAVMNCNIPGNERALHCFCSYFYVSTVTSCEPLFSNAWSEVLFVTSFFTFSTLDC